METPNPGWQSTYAVQRRFKPRSITGGYKGFSVCLKYLLPTNCVSCHKIWQSNLGQWKGGGDYGRPGSWKALICDRVCRRYVCACSMLPHAEPDAEPDQRLDADQGVRASCNRLTHRIRAICYDLRARCGCTVAYLCKVLDHVGLTLGRKASVCLVH